jgi:hypothetical protein
MGEGQGWPWRLAIVRCEVAVILPNFYEIFQCSYKQAMKYTHNFI